MTDRVKGFVITLEQDIREDDAEHLVAAIRMIRGVLDVEPIKAKGYADIVAENRVFARVLDDVRKLMAEWSKGIS